MSAPIKAPGVSRGIEPWAVDVREEIPSLTLRACMTVPIKAPGVSRGIEPGDVGLHGQTRAYALVTSGRCG